MRMSKAEEICLHLSFSDGRPAASDLSAVNAGLRQIGSRLWPLDLRGLPSDCRVLLDKPSLSADEVDALMSHFLFSRNRLLELIGKAGREPHVSEGGALSTRVTNHGYDYPQFYLHQPGVDFSRFDRYHCNRAEDGTGVDEVMQMLSGGGFRNFHRLEDGSELTLTLSCPGPEWGWILTYDGAPPHIGSLAEAWPGSKMIVQVIGPPEWVMHYVD